MAARALLAVVVPLLLLVVASSTDDGAYGRLSIRRRSFPKGFVFGTASSSYQYEGGAMEGGRGSSIWDNFAHQHPDKIADRSNGDVAVDSYHLYKEDVHLMKDMGMDAYRFSISWTRILPDGTLRGGVNREGIKYYNNLIDELLSKGVQPFVTLFHWDSPQGLEDKYEGFLSPSIILHLGNICRYSYPLMKACQMFEPNTKHTSDQSITSKAGCPDQATYRVWVQTGPTHSRRHRHLSSIHLQNRYRHINLARPAVNAPMASDSASSLRASIITHPSPRLCCGSPAETP